MDIPDRITPLIKQLEAGQALTVADVKRLAVLQVLDVAKIGEDFARAAIQRETDATSAFKKSLEAKCQTNP